MVEAAQRIVNQADSPTDSGSWAAAIALCGTACEVSAAYVFDAFLSQPKRYHETVKSAVRDLLDSPATVNLEPTAQRALWFALAHDNLMRSWQNWSK